MTSALEYLAIGLAAWMTASLLFCAILVQAGLRRNARLEAKAEYRWWASPVIQHLAEDR